METYFLIYNNKIVASGTAEAPHADATVKETNEIVSRGIRSALDNYRSFFAAEEPTVYRFAYIEGGMPTINRDHDDLEAVVMKNLAGKIFRAGEEELLYRDLFSKRLRYGIFAENVLSHYDDLLCELEDVVHQYISSDRSKQVADEIEGIQGVSKNIEYWSGNQHRWQEDVSCILASSPWKISVTGEILLRDDIVLEDEGLIRYSPQLKESERIEGWRATRDGLLLAGFEWGTSSDGGE